MSEASEGYEKLSGQFEILSGKMDLSNERLELYKKVSDQQQESTKAEIKAYQDANKQQLNVSLGVLVTAAIAIVVSAVISR
ncbi:MAG: hypothetical protein RLZZ499_861 [Cyanobacteriota bacterium]